jgi:hypothetical protein
MTTKEIRQILAKARADDAARETLYNARLYLLRRGHPVMAGDTEAIQTLARIEMGLCYNASMPGRGI